MKEYDLGKLEKVDLRKAWEREDNDFTPWLALPENLALLSEAIGGGLELELVTTEGGVGHFRADIICKDTSDIKDSLVLIENQLEKSDHTHLGQLLTYTAGLHAATIIWIASKIQEEHRAALDWLNENTHANFRFFGLEVELWRIGNSPAAAKFNIVSQPNSWERTISNSIRQDSELSEMEDFYLNYWQKLLEYLKDNNSTIQIPKTPTRRSFQNFAIGRGEFTLYGIIKTRMQQTTIELYVSDRSKTLFKMLKQEEEAINNEIGEKLKWMELPDKDASKIVLANNCDPKDEEDKDNQFAWFKEKLEAYDKAFRHRIKKLDASEWKGEDDEE